MKKLSLIMAMVLIATIGGVYATWTYSGNDVNSPHEHAVLRMEDYTQTGSLGTLALNASGATISIDEDSTTTHKAKVVISGNFVITFTPSETAPADVKNNAIPITYTLSSSIDVTTWKYDSKQIFNAITGATDIAVDTNVYSWVKSGSVFTMTIPATDILTGKIVLANEFILDDISAYEAFDSALGAGKFGLTVKSAYVSA